MIKRLFLICFIIFILGNKLNAQSYNFVKFGVREGLLHSLVTGISQDNRGDLWMSTGGGLCRFNGVDFEFITTRDGLSFTRLTCVTTDDDDNIWVGSSKGLNFVHGKTVLAIQDSLIENEILAISSAGKSMIWALTNSGVFKVEYSNSKFHVSKISTPSFHSLATSQIFQDRILANFIFQTKTGKVLYSYNGQLFCLQNGNVTIINKAFALRVNAGVELSDSSVVFGTNKGIYRLNGDNLSAIENRNTDKISIEDLCFDGEKIWLLGRELVGDNLETNLYSINLNNPDYFRKISRNDGLIDEPTQISVDHEGNIWTTSNNGVSLFKPNPFVAYTSSDGLVGNKIWGIYRTKDGSLFVGTIGEGLTIIKDNQFIKYTKKNGLPDNYVGRIFQSKNGDIYVGTSNAGLCKAEYNKKTNTYTFPRTSLLLGSKVRIDDVVEDKQGLIWVATSRGLFYTKNRKDYKRFPLFQGDTGQVFIQKLLNDSVHNRMWIGTRFNGVFSIQGNAAKQFEKIDKNEEVSSLAMDSLGDLWVGTRFHGVFVCRDNKIERISEVNGLASNLVYILNKDGYNSMWVGTNLGLDRIDLTALQNEERIEIRHYGSDEGLVDLETNLNGVLNNADLGFWIATNGGLLKYEHAEDRQNRIPPKVRILKLKLHSKGTDWTKFSSNINAWSGLPENLVLKHDQNHLTFEFVGISFRNPRMVKYAWKMDGFDTDWITSSSRQAIYSNIPPGDYTFRLKAANSDMTWSDDVLSMPFTVLVPFWKTWWFRVSVVLVVAILIYLYFLSRIKSLHEKQKELENLVWIRTMELRAQFEIVDSKNKQIFDSLTYAKFLQNAILTSIDEVKRSFSDVFIYNRPKDFVSGDFYWHKRNKDVSIFAVADCTGHGVPGAIISVICENALRQAVMSCNYENPALILHYANIYVVDTFTNTHKDIHPGMEIALCTFNHKTYELTFSGAKLGMHIISKGKLVKLKHSVFGIGWDVTIPKFVNETLNLDKGDTLYLFTDGFGDQFEPKSKKKFSGSRLKKLLNENYQLPFSEQHELLNKEFESWQGTHDQIDDVLVIGLKV